MSAYKYDESEAQGLVKEGDYEAVIERLEVKTISTGKNKLSVSFRIRDDVEQPYKNKWLFKDIWEEKENPGVFNRKQINKLLGTQVIEDGTEFETINDVIKFLERTTLIIHVAVEFDDYNQKYVNTISYFKKSKVVPKQLSDEDGESESEPQVRDNPEHQPHKAEKVEGVIVGDDDELPF